MTPRALVTGGAGFIGSHLVDALLDDGWAVTVIDDFNDSYAATVKRGNVARHLDYRSYRLIETDIRALGHWVLRAGGEYDVVVHLAARAGVRPSITQPELYEDVNVRGTQGVLDFALSRHVPRFVFASSSSVYGVNPRTPWHEEEADLRPISPYATTKLAAECLGWRPSVSAVLPRAHRILSSSRCDSLPSMGPASARIWRFTASRATSSTGSRSPCSVTARQCVTTRISTTSSPASDRR